jgi:hypothetical protein
MLRFSQCMRAHGVPSFPDPIAPGTAPSGGDQFLGNGSNPSSSPTYAKASAACGVYAVATPVTPAGAARVESQQLRYAHCMRAHGEPDFPDPGSSGFVLPRSIDQNSFAYQEAEQACERLQPGWAGPPGTGGS